MSRSFDSAPVASRPRRVRAVVLFSCCLAAAWLTPARAPAQEEEPSPLAAEGEDDALDVETGILSPQGAGSGSSPGASRAPSDRATGRPRWPSKPIEVHLSLEDAIWLGLERNFDIRIFRIDHEVADRDVTIEKSAFHPFFEMGANYSKNRSPTASFLDLGQGGVSQTVQVNPTEFTTYFVGLRGTTPIGTSYSLRFQENAFDRPASALFGFNPQVSSSTVVQVTQPLLRGAWYPYNTSALRIAANSRRVALEQLELQISNTVFAIEDAYWQLAYSLKNYESRAKALEVGEQDLSNAKKRLEVGTLAPIDVTIVASQVSLRRVEFRDAELELENARDSLLQLLNERGNRSLRMRWAKAGNAGRWDRLLVIPTTPVETDAVRPDRDASIETAFESRPDYHQIAYELRNQRIRIAQAENELLPAVDLTGSWEQQGLADDFDVAVSSLSSGDFYSWTVGVQVEVPLSQIGPRTRLLRTKDQLMRIELQRAQLENEIVLEVDQVLRRLAALFAKVQDLEERVRLQEQILEAERKKLGVGKSIDYTVSTIENDLISSQAQALRARADYQIAIADYHRATGTLLERHDIVFETHEPREWLEPREWRRFHARSAAEERPGEDGPSDLPDGGTDAR